MKNKIITIVFLIIIIGLGIISIITKDNILSTFERRKLATLPKLDKDFTSNLDDYLLDQFVFRNKLINLNSFINRKKSAARLIAADTLEVHYSFA